MKILTIITLLTSLTKLTATAQWSSGTDIYNTNTGNIGIGTTSPVSKLDVAGPVNIMSGNNLTWGGLFENGNPTIAAASLVGLVFYPQGNISNEKMRITPSGNLGIGTNTPLGKLDVLGTAYFNNPAGQNYAAIAVGASGDTYGTVGYGYRFSTTSDVYSYASNDYSSQLFFTKGGIKFRTAPPGAAGNNITYTDAITLLQNGKVGIGTVNPDEKLTVKGTVHASEILVDIHVPAPDYVFKKDYILRSLKEVEAYIAANQHLPEIASAKEMETKGIELGEMNMKLLKKIEELTLYVIDLKKENDNLKSEVSEIREFLKK